MRYNAATFDVNDLLFGIELVYYEATQAVADKVGLPYNKGLYLRFLGISGEKTWAGCRMIFSEFDKIGVQRFIDDSYQETLEHLSQGTARIKPDVLEFPSFLGERQTPRIVASSNQRAVIKPLLEKNDLFGQFETIVPAEGVQRVKPDPGAFLLANQKLDTARKGTLILEDSQDGILTTFTAEIPVVMIPDPPPPSQGLVKKAVGTVSPLHEILALLR